MKLVTGPIVACFILSLAPLIHAGEVKTVNYGEATVIYDYQLAGEEVATLSVNALVSETNDSLRALKNTDRRRLGKLGQLIYQCKLLLRTSADAATAARPNTPMLISRNFSLYTDVDLALDEGERVGIKVRSLQPVDGDSLFGPTLGQGQLQKEFWSDIDEGAAINLRQLNVNLLKESDVISTAENIDIILRFPIFQVQKTAQQWSYNFNLRDFREAVRHADENCTLETLAGLINRKG